MIVSILKFILSFFGLRVLRDEEFSRLERVVCKAKILAEVVPANVAKFQTEDLKESLSWCEFFGSMLTGTKNTTRL